jgi:dTDP-4-amino-4,6-dideoxygalactose transaminase
MTVRFVDLVAQQADVGDDVEAAVLKALRGTDLVLGHEVERFEEEFAEYCGVAGAVGTDSGLSALELILRAYGVGPGDEVITAANTFIATALAISATGASPVLVDVDPRTYTIDSRLFEAAITERTKAVVPVHLYGQPAEMDLLCAIAHRRGLVVVEDACQAHGARSHGRRAGSLGDAAAFSFYPSKNLGAYGDGGAVVSSDGALLDTVRLLRNYGQREKYRHDVRGFNRRLDTLQAAALRVKLPHLDRWNAARRERAAVYGQALRDVGIEPPHVIDDVEHVWHVFAVEVDQRDVRRRCMLEAGIETGVHYPVPVHCQAAYADLRVPAGGYPVTERAAQRLLSLPMYPQLPLDLVPVVVDAVVASARPTVTALG